MKVILCLLITAVIWGIALSPLWLFLTAKSLADPEGFWQNFVMFGFGLWALGGLQLFLLVVGVFITLFVWTEVLD